MNELHLSPREQEAIKKCPVCGKVFYIPCQSLWAYKKNVKRKAVNHNTLYFCKYSCKRKYDEQYSRDDIKARKREAEKKITDRVRSKCPGRPPTPEEDYKEKTCTECRYCMHGKYGFTDCTIYSMAINPYRPACKRYRSKEINDV